MQCCPKCGKEISSDTACCNYCGADIDVSSAEKTPIDLVRDREESAISSKTPSKLKYVMMGFIALAALVIAGAFFGADDVFKHVEDNQEARAQEALLLPPEEQKGRCGDEICNIDESCDSCIEDCSACPVEDAVFNINVDVMRANSGGNAWRWDKFETPTPSTRDFTLSYRGDATIDAIALAMFTPARKVFIVM